MQRVFVHESIAKDFAARLAEATGRLRVGPPESPDTEVGPLIRPAEVARVGQWVEEAVARGGSVLTGGKPLDHNCYAPTVVYDPPDDCRLSREEVFGPVVCIYPYADLDTAIAWANALPWAFQAACMVRL